MKKYPCWRVFRNSPGFGRFINVFWSDIGVTRAEIGALSLATMVASFIGAGFWYLDLDFRAGTKPKPRPYPKP